MTGRSWKSKKMRHWRSSEAPSSRYAMGVTVRGVIVMTDLGHPETLFATAGQYRVAYRMSGAGPPDVVMTPGLWSHMELIREDPGHVNFRRRMQSFSRQIGFDSLGTGLSDRPTGGSAVEYWIGRCAAGLHCANSPRGGNVML